jgi:hypothetical protein
MVSQIFGKGSRHCYYRRQVKSQFPEEVNPCTVCETSHPLQENRHLRRDPKEGRRRIGASGP